MRTYKIYLVPNPCSHGRRMSTEPLRSSYPGLGPFLLSNVRLTGIKIGAGSYGSVEEVAIPGAICAAKKIHDVFLDRSEIPEAEITRATEQFVKECQLMSTVLHPNIVQFMGVCFFPGSRLPSLVMERLLTSLHDLLDPEMPDDVPKPPSFPLSLKVSILHDVASGLAYLHERNPPVIHRDLSARNILLGQGMVAKIVDLGVARIAPRTKTAATMTTGPGASVYMPPEATSAAPTNTEKSKYGLSIDIFSLGVVAIFTIGESFPCELLAPTYLDEETGLLVARSELQRRSKYVQDMNNHLRTSGQLCKDHPLIQLIQRCLHNGPLKRPIIREVLRLLEHAKATLSDHEWKKVLGLDMQATNLGQSQHELQLRVKELEEQLQAKNTAISAHLNKEIELQSRVEELEQQSQAKEVAKEKELQTHIQVLESQNKTEEKELESRVQELEQILATNKTNERELQAENQLLRTRSVAKEREWRALQTRIAELETQNRTKERDLKSHNQEIERVLANNKSKESELQAENRKLQEQSVTKERELQTRIQGLEARETELMLQVQELEQLLQAKNKEIAELQSSMKKADLKSQQLKKQLEELASKGGNLAKANETIKIKEQQIFELEQRIVRVKEYDAGLVRAKDRAVAEARRKLELKEGELQSSKDHADDLTRRLQYRESEMESLKTMSRRELDRYLDQKKRADQAKSDADKRIERQQKKEEIRKKYGLKN